MSDPYDRTRRIPEPEPQRPLDETQVIPPGATAPPPGARRPGADPRYADQPEPEPEPERRWPQYLVAGLVGVLAGFAFAFVVIALGTRGAEDADGVGLAEAQDRIAALEADVGARDARVAELESQLAEAEAAVGERAEDVEAQRRALDERAAAMDARATALDQREMALDERERQIADREAAAPEPQPGEPAPEEPPPGDGPSLPEFDPEAAETIVERVLERLREMFGQ